MQNFPNAWFFRRCLDKNPKNINWDYYGVRAALIPSFKCMMADQHWLQFWRDATETSLTLRKYDFKDPYLNQKK